MDSIYAHAGAFNLVQFQRWASIFFKFFKGGIENERNQRM